jgi:hypothetical protein
MVDSESKNELKTCVLTRVLLQSSPDTVGGRITLSHTFVVPDFTPEVSLRSL